MSNAWVKMLYTNQFVQAALFILALWILYRIRLVLFIFLFAFIIMSGVRPLVEFLVKKGLPRIVATLLPYLTVLVILGTVGFTMISGIFSQLGELFASIPAFASKLGATFGQQAGDVISAFENAVSGVGERALSLPFTLLFISVSVVSIVVLSIYMLWYHPYVKSFAELFGSKEQAHKTLDRLQSGMGAWVRGQLLLSLVVACVAGIGLFVLGVDYPLALAVIAGLLEVVQFFGPIIAAIIAVTVAAGTSLTTAGLTLVLFILIQQMENHILVPQIMKRSVDVHPITVILAILIGNEMFGVPGAIAAVPTLVIATILWKSARENAA